MTAHKHSKNSSMSASRLFGLLLIIAAIALVAYILSGVATSKSQSQAKVNRAQTSITVLTGPTSGIYYPIGNAFSAALGEMGYQTSATATGASGENISAILSGKGELAIAMSDSVIQAIEGFGAYENKSPATDLRAMMGLWPNVVQIVTTADSGIKKFEDLKGKRVGVGAIKSGVEINARMIFEAYGMSYKDALVEFVNYGEAVDMMLKGECDAAFVTSGLGNATIKKLGVAKKIVFVPVEGEALRRLTEKYPFYIGWTIPKDVYGTDADTPTAALINVMLVAKSLPDDVVYDMLDGFYSERGLRTIGASHATARREIRLDTALRGIHGTSIQLHPGAEMFYREKGLLQ